MFFYRSPFDDFLLKAVLLHYTSRCVSTVWQRNLGKFWEFFFRFDPVDHHQREREEWLRNFFYVFWESIYQQRPSKLLCTLLVWTVSIRAIPLFFAFFRFPWEEINRLNRMLSMCPKSIRKFSEMFDFFSIVAKCKVCTNIFRFLVQLKDWNQ